MAVAVLLPSGPPVRGNVLGVLPLVLCPVLCPVCSLGDPCWMGSSVLLTVVENIVVLCRDASSAFRQSFASSGLRVVLELL